MSTEKIIRKLISSFGIILLLKARPSFLRANQKLWPVNKAKMAKMSDLCRSRRGASCRYQRRYQRMFCICKSCLCSVMLLSQSSMYWKSLAGIILPNMWQHPIAVFHTISGIIDDCLRALNGTLPRLFRDRIGAPTRLIDSHRHRLELGW